VAASGTVIGWTGAHGREHLYRAILEGLAFEQRLVGEGVAEALESPVTEYVALGGGSHSNLWCQILADVTGVPIVRAGTAEATCLGAGIVAAAAAHWYRDAVHAAAAMARTGARFEPRRETHGIYDALYRQVYRPLFPTLRPLLHRLAELTDAGA
jgi:xylulokinase